MAPLASRKGILFSFRGKLHEALDKAALQRFWVFRGAAWIVRNKAPLFAECRRKRFDGFRLERIIPVHRLGASRAQIARPTNTIDVLIEPEGQPAP
jgi:hypothetical protein